MTRFALNPATKSMDIIVDGVVVESVLMAVPQSQRDERLKVHGYVFSKPITARQQYRQEQRERGRNNGIGYTRSGRSR